MGLVGVCGTFIYCTVCIIYSTVSTYTMHYFMKGKKRNKNKPQLTRREKNTKDPSEGTYRGPSAGSEPEVKHITNYIKRQKPMYGLMDFHCYYQAVLFPYGKVEYIMKYKRLGIDMYS